MTYANAYAPPHPIAPQLVEGGDQVYTDGGWRQAAGPGKPDSRGRIVVPLAGGGRARCNRGESLLIRRLIRIPKTA